MAMRGQEARPLDVYFIDVEGGQATLVVTPAGRSLLVDGGFGGFEGRDTKRVIAAARDAGVERIDFLVATHFHGDHIGAIPEIARQMPVTTFVDYGAPVERGLNVVAPYAAYAAVRSRSRHLKPAPGDRIPIEGAEVTVLTAGGDALSAPVTGGGQSNEACGGLERRRDDPSENGRSVGLLVRTGEFRFINLGDLGWNALARLVCPANLIGRADVFLVPHHSNPDAAMPALFRAIGARAVISDNGATKGGAAATFRALRRAPGPPDVWQLHRSLRAGAGNFPEERIANLDQGQTAFWIKVSASRDGRFTVTNTRNGVSKTYE
jgi:beta-lactamase superfamily II metal-dependent hydrolase